MIIKSGLKKEILYLISYGILLLVLYKFLLNVTNLFPFSVEASYDDIKEKYVLVLSLVGELFHYMPICFGMMMLFTTIFREYFKIMYVFGWLTVFLMGYYIFVCIIGEEKITVLFIAICIIVMTLIFMNYCKYNYSTVTLFDKIQAFGERKKTIIVLIAIIGFIIINVIYIFIPKRIYYMYVESYQGYIFTFETENDFVKEVAPIEIRCTPNIGINPKYYCGWIFEAVHEGDVNVCIRCYSPGTQEYELIKKTVRINDKLKICNLPDWNYICNIYRVNLYAVVFSIVTIICIFAERKNKM